MGYLQTIFFRSYRTSSNGRVFVLYKRAADLLRESLWVDPVAIAVVGDFGIRSVPVVDGVFLSGVCVPTTFFGEKIKSPSISEFFKRGGKARLSKTVVFLELVFCVFPIFFLTTQVAVFDEGLTSDPLDVVVVDGVEERGAVLLISTLKGAGEVCVEVVLNSESSSGRCVLLEEEGEARSFQVPDEGTKFTQIVCKLSDPSC